MNARVIFDSASAVNALANMKLLRELKKVNADIGGLGDGAIAAMKRLKLIARAKQIRAELGAPKNNTVQHNVPTPFTGAPHANVSSNVSGDFGLKKSGIKTRERINSQVAGIVEQIRTGAKDAKSLTPDEIALLKQYSGKGGLTENSQYEYYTPVAVAEGAWDILKVNGFSNGNVLEPSTGAGVFSATKPQGAIITGAEIDPIAATVNQVLHPDDVILNQSFEKMAVSAPDDFFDAVVGNVPFGDARGPSASDDPAYKSEKRIERYFISRVIDKTRPGGLITLVVPTGVVANTSGPWKKFRAEISRKAEFLGAHKLPSKTFAGQGTDVVTDIIVLRKHPSDFLAKVDSLPSDTLSSANVLWDEFIGGKYWLGEGKRFIHGTYVPADVKKFRSSEQVIPDSGMTPESLKQKLAVQFDSRIDWALLDSAAPVIVYYSEGDRRVVNGKEYEFDGAHWSEVKYEIKEGQLDPVKYGASSMDGLMQMVSSSSAMLGMSFEQAFRIYKDFPNLLNQQQKMAVEFSQSQSLDAFREQAYRGSLIGSVVTQYLAKANIGDADDGDRAFVKGMVENEFNVFGHPRGAKGFYLEGDMARYFGAYLSAIDEKGNVSSALADGVTEAVGYDPENPLSVVEYMAKARMDGMLTLEAFKTAYTGKREIGGLGDIADVDGIAFTPDGMVTTSRNYCSGEVYVKSAELMGAMEGEKDPRIKAKFQAQIDLMMVKVKRTGIEDITFGLRDKWINPSYKLEFLEQAGYPFKYLTEGLKESDTGEKFVGEVDSPESSDPNGNWVAKKSGGVSDFYAQLAKYMNGKSIGLDVRDKGGEDKESRVERYRELVTGLEEQFMHFMQSRQDFSDIERTYNTTFNNYVPPEYDIGDLKLDGVSEQVRPHWYQNQGVRKLSAEGAGILGDDVGLGKTYSAVAFSAYDRQMGRSKKHCIVVPKSVLANWYQESKKLLGNHNGVMFVGFEPARDKQGNIKTEPVLDENGQPKANKYTGEIEYQDVLDEDSRDEVYTKMHQIPQSKVGMVVMTYEKFATIPMREESRLKYAEKWAEKKMMSRSDADKIGKSYQDAKNEDRAKGEYADGGTKKKNELPYFEDMGFDRVIVDEAHSFKNSFSMGGDTQNLAYLPNPSSAQRARDMAMKTAWVRDKYDGKGTILLTATPVANSPIEIFNMLNMVVDSSEFERIGIYTPDDFVRQFGIIEMVDKVRVSGELVKTEGLKGFKNLNSLRSLFHRYANMRNARDVDPDGNTLKLPEAVEMLTQVTMNTRQTDLYASLREEAKKSGNPKAVAAGTARPMFAVIRDMDRVTTDIDLYNRTITFLFKSSDETKIDALIKALPISMIVKMEDEDSGEKVEVPVSKQTDYSISGDVLTYVAPDLYEDAVVSLFKKFGIDYVSHPLMPKYAKLIENMRAELDGKGKQIIFTEEKSQHGKLLRLIVNNLPVVSDQVAIINADTAGGDKLQQISDAFNRGDIRIVIANKKAEVGVNLQKGTSAIHHMTLPWNPASIQQRNGRGVRQGNTQPQVRVYYYQARGSFDEYRLDLLKNKGNWIAALMDKRSENDTAENSEAMGAIEQAALLADNREEFLKAIAEQKSKKEAEVKAKRDNTAKVKLNQLSSITTSLTNFDADFGKAKKDAAEAIAKAEASLEKVKREGDTEAVTRRQTQLAAAKMRESKLAGTWDKKKSDLESQRRQITSFLKAGAAKGEIPFDAAVIDAPESVVVTSGRLVIFVGKTFMLKEGADYRSRGTRIVRITKVEFGIRSADFEMVVGTYFGSQDGSGVVDSLFDGAVEVGYTPDELEIMKMLNKEYRYDRTANGIVSIGKEVFIKYREQVKISGGALVRIDGALEWEYSIKQGDTRIVWPDSADSLLVSELVALYKANALGESSGIGYSLIYAASAVFGDGWENEIRAHLNTAKREDIAAKASEMLNAIAAQLPSNTADDLSDAALKITGYPVLRNVESSVTEWMKAGDFINMDDVSDLVKEVAYLIAAKLRSKADDAKNEERRIAEDSIKSDPNYKEVSPEMVAKFAALGIDAFFNTEEVVTDRGVKYPMFGRVWLKDNAGKNGRIYAMKEMLKARFKALFCNGIARGASKYGNATWHVDASVSIEEIYSLLG